MNRNISHLLIFIIFLIIIGFCTCSHSSTNRETFDIEDVYEQLTPNSYSLNFDLIPKAQLEAGYSINLTLAAISLLSRNIDNFVTRLLIGLFCLISLSNLKNFIGYKFELIPGGSDESYLSYCPRIHLRKLNFPSTEFVHIERWSFIPISWIIQTLILLPEDCYNSLKSDFKLPDSNILIIIYFVLLMSILGLFRQ